VFPFYTGRGGDSYTKRAKLGMFFYAYYQFQAETVKQKQEIQASAEAQFGKITEVKLGFQASMEKNSSCCKNYLQVQPNSRRLQKKLPAPDKLEEWVSGFPEFSWDGPEILWFETQFLHRDVQLISTSSIPISKLG
jgi:hypothetical protein